MSSRRYTWEIETQVAIDEEARRAARGIRSKKTKELVAKGLPKYRPPKLSTYEQLMEQGLHRRRIPIPKLG